MLKGLLVSSALIGLTAVSVQAATLQEGRSTYLHHHHHAAHHYNMTYGRSNGGHHGTSYGVGSPSPRTTATGGNPGGYSTRN